MKCTLVIGNGFDLDAGLKTSYKDFVRSEYWPFSHSTEVHGQETLASYLRKKSEFDTWFDVEEALYEYSKAGLGMATLQGVNIGNIDKADFEKLRCSLTAYLKDQEECFSVNCSSMGISVLNALLTSKTDIKIYSFNYTNLQHIADKYKIEEKVICEHIHGSTLGNDIILGVGDKQDITPHYFYLSKIAAPNYSSHHIIPDMLESDEVIIFGHSLGSNDYPYFEPFLQNQLTLSKETKKRKKITIFIKDENGKLEIKKKLMHMTGSQVTLLYSLNDVNIFCTDGSMYDKIEKHLQSINKDWGRF